MVTRVIDIKLIFILLVFLAVCPGINCKSVVDSRITPRELEVYKTLLDGKPERMVVILPDSGLDVLGIDKAAMKEILDGLRSETFDNFAEVNSIPPKIEDDAKAEFNYLLVSGVDFKKDDPEHAAYYAFSRVGFSRDGRQAVVRFSDLCRPLCGRGAYYLLENKNGVWEIMQESEYVRS